MNLTEIHKIASQIQIKLFKKSGSHHTGNLRSSFRGSGLQFKEHRIYEAGDEIRFIDWKASARKNDVLVKTFEEERNLSIGFIIDFSPSMLMGYGGVAKIQAAIEICALFILVSQQSNDNIIPIIFTDEMAQMEKCKGQAGLIKFIKFLERKSILNSDGTINRFYYNNRHYKSLEYDKVFNILRGRREIVIASDLLDGLGHEFIKTLKKFKHIHCFRLSLPIDEGRSSLTSVPSRNSRGISYSVFNAKKSEDVTKMKEIIPINMDGLYLDQVAHALSH